MAKRKLILVLPFRIFSWLCVYASAEGCSVIEAGHLIINRAISERYKEALLRSPTEEELQHGKVKE